METQTNNTKSRFSIGFFFLCLGVLVSLITSVVSFLNLVFETLNKRFPDVLNSTYQYGYSTYEYEGIRMALATLIIFFPIFVLISYYWNKFTKSGLGHVDEIVRKWLIYIILFLSSVVVVVDMVTLVRYFISGEVTSRFILKVVATLVVAILVGFYYIFTLRENKNHSSIGIIFSLAGVVLVAVVISYSFAIMGSPFKQRMLRLDDRRVNDLQTLQYQIINFWQQKEKLPEDLSALSNPISGQTLPVPPEFEKGEKYEYKVLAPLKFELCATFNLPIPKGWREYSNGGYGIMMPSYPTREIAYDQNGSMKPYPYPGGVNESWDHQAGRTCFERTIDKDIYPPFPKPKESF